MTSSKPHTLCKKPHKTVPLTSGICGRRYEPMIDHEYFKNPQVDFRIALVALAILAVVGVVSGIGPAIRAVSIRPVEALRDE